MNLTKLLMSSVVALGLNAGQPGPCPSPQGQPPCPMLHMAKPLGLSEKQVEQLKAKCEAHAKSLEAKRTEAHKAREAVMKAMGDPAVKPDQLKTLAAKEAQAHLDELLEGHALLEETMALLSPEQREKLSKMKPEGPSHGKGGHEGPGHEGFEGPGGPREGHGRPGRPGSMPPPPPHEGCCEEGPQEGRP